MEHTGNRILKTLFFLIWIIAIIHMLAEFNFWYWKFLWLDIPMHFIGGLWLGLAGLWLWYHTPHLARLRERTNLSPFLVALVTGVLIGLVWEAYEYLVWTYSGKGLPPEYPLDTVSDLVMDTLGAVTGYGLYRVLARKSVARPE